MNAENIEEVNSLVQGLVKGHDTYFDVEQAKRLIELVPVAGSDNLNVEYNNASGIGVCSFNHRQGQLEINVYPEYNRKHEEARCYMLEYLRGSNEPIMLKVFGSKDMGTVTFTVSGQRTFHPWKTPLENLQYREDFNHSEP